MLSTMNIELDNNTTSIEPPGEDMPVLNGQAPLEETCEEPLTTRWLEGSTTNVGQHSVMILSECPGSRACLAAELHETFRDHYMSREMFSKRVADLVLQRRFLNLVSFWPEIASRKPRTQSCQARGQAAMERCSRPLSGEASL